MPFLPPRDLSDPEIEPASPALQVDSLPLSHLDYCKMVNDMTPADIQRMAQQILAAKRCIEVTMLSE